MLRHKELPMVRAEEYLRQTLEQARKEARALTKADLLREEEAIIEDILTRYTYSPLVVDQYKIRVVEHRPNELLVSWPVSGNIDLIGKLDSSGEFTNTIVNDGTLTENWIYPQKISDNSTVLIQIKNNLNRKDTYLKTHFQSLNILVGFYNMELKNVITSEVKQRVSTLTQIEKIEVFLNTHHKKGEPN